MGIPAFALSQAFLSREGVDWSPVSAFGEQVIRKLWQPGENRAWNVNFPACDAGVIRQAQWCNQSTGSIQRPRLLAGQDARSLPYCWGSIAVPGTLRHRKKTSPCCGKKPLR